jgi:hypothetical protein
MADEPYKTLGISRTATAKQIRAAFLKLAKTTHPDLKPADPKAEERFKAINAATCFPIPTGAHGLIAVRSMPVREPEPTRGATGECGPALHLAGFVPPTRCVA